MLEVQDKDIIKERFNIEKFKYVFDTAPHSAPRMTRSDRWKKRPIVVSYFAFKDEVRLKANLMGYKLSGVLDILFVVPMPKSWSKKKKREMYLTKHEQTPDRDNYLKAFQDAFNEDDSFVWDGRTTKIWGEKPYIIIY